MSEVQKKRIYWNRGWQFSPVFTEELLHKGSGMSDQKLETVMLPHTVAVTPYHYFDESIYQGIYGYRKCFIPDNSWKGKHVFMTIEAAGHSAKVYLNGTLLGEHHCGYTAFQTDLASALLYGEENILVIQVDSRESQNIPPFGHVIDYMTFGGLYREVYLEIKETTYIANVFARTRGVTDGTPVLDCDVTIDIGEKKITLTGEKQKQISPILAGSGLKLKQSLLCTEGVSSSIVMFEENCLQNKVDAVKLWNCEQPYLYLLRTELLKDGQVLDTHEVRIGFREAEFRADGFYLNGEKVKLRGLNRHQSFPYVGYAMPKSMQCFDAEILKNELGVNAVRTSHYPHSPHFLNRCDELGILVFTEIPGWQYIGDEAWQKQAVVNTEEMVCQYRNHPSIILWGVRINESQDNDTFYQRTNQMAHSLDDTRQTSGVRFLQKSSLLEDVYAYNDFSHEGNNAGCQKKKKNTPDQNKGYLISEYNGHMFPTKAYDSEDHRVEHMLRHARVMNAYYGEEDIAGGFAWCMFDYNTHKDFGSGDRICYHGVCDMFRNPKLAAALYQSQSEQEDVLEISSAMDIGEHPACLMKDVYAITNADSVRLYKNDTFVREFSAKQTPFKKMPHGPILLNDFIGDLMERGEGFSKRKSEDVKRILMSACRNGMAKLPLSTKLLAAKCILFRGMRMQDAVDLYNKYVGNWGGAATSYKFEAIKNGKVVKTVEKKPMTEPQLLVTCSHATLREENTYDVAAVRIRAVSESGNILHYSQAPIELTTEGPIEIIGPSLISLQGGMGGTYVKTTGKSGEAKLILHSELSKACADIELVFHVEADKENRDHIACQ